MNDSLNAEGYITTGQTPWNNRISSPEFVPSGDKHSAHLTICFVMEEDLGELLGGGAAGGKRHGGGNSKHHRTIQSDGTYLTLRHAFGVEGGIRDSVAFVAVPDPEADGGGLMLGYLVHPIGQQVKKNRDAARCSACMTIYIARNVRLRSSSLGKLPEMCCVVIRCSSSLLSRLCPVDATVAAIFCTKQTLSI